MYIHYTKGGCIMDQVAIRAWGNSQGIRIPKKNIGSNATQCLGHSRN